MEYSGMGNEAGTAHGKGIRMWPALLILAASGGALLWNEIFREVHTQNRFLADVVILIVTLALLLLWVLLFSRLRWKIRLGVFLLAAGVAAFLYLTVRIDDVSGDLVPILAWKWSKAPSLAIPEASDSHEVRGEGNTVVRLEGLADFPQFLGPDRNATLTGISLWRDWSAQPPRELWRRAVGAAYSAFAVRGHRAITQEQRQEREAVVCYDIANGEILWVHDDEARFEKTIGGVGPRATPTIAGNDVYTLGATGLLNCLDTDSGTHRWGRDVIADVNGSVCSWGMSSSPLVVDTLVITAAGGRNGGSLAAYDRHDGKLRWKDGDDRNSYASPLLATLAAVPQVVILNHNSVAGHDVETGKMLWSHPWPGSHPKVAQPLPLPGDRLFVSSGYDVGAASFLIARTGGGESSDWGVTEEWRSNRMKAKFANMVWRDGYVYGFDDGIFTCVEARTGERAWKRGRYGHGQLLLLGELLLVTTEKGEVVLVEATPQRHIELTRFTVFSGKTWNSPTLAGRYLLLRNHREAVCYELPLSLTE